MKKVHHIAPTFFICAITAMLVTGCLGPKVLEETSAHVPAQDPEVELRLKTKSPADVLVIYNEQASQSEKSTRRAFYLFANQNRILNGHRPAYVSLAEADHLKAIPIFKATPANANSITNELYAVATLSKQFKLESHGHLVLEFALPEYEQWLTAKKLFLFPAAVGADAVGVGAIVGAEMAISDPTGTANAAAGLIQKH